MQSENTRTTMPGAEGDSGPLGSSDSDDYRLPLDAFIRSVEIRKAKSHSLFIGAGASISSGLPSADTCIWEWKRDLFLTSNPGIEEQFSELSLPTVRNRIQRWIDGQGGYPKVGDPEEYGFYIQQCYPISDDRRAYFQEKVRTARPHIGYLMLCHLNQTGLIRSVWTTNFDSLAARAASSFDISPLEVGIDSQERIPAQVQRGDLLCVALHGDYRYDALKNTAEELQRQESALRSALVKELQENPVIVCGYSGRDVSILDALKAGCETPGGGPIYWCGYGDGDPPDNVAKLLNHARRHGKQAFYVPGAAFDDVMKRLALHCLSGDQRRAAKTDIEQYLSPELLKREPFKLPVHQKNTLIKSNCFEIECPGEVLSFDLKSWPQEKVWSWLRDQTKGHAMVAVPFRGRVLCLGLFDQVKNLFGANINGVIERIPIATKELAYEDGAVISLLRSALVKSMAATVAIETDGNSLLWEPTSYKKVKDGIVDCFLHDAAVVYLRRIGGKQYLVLKPTLKVVDRSGVEHDNEISGRVKLAELGYQHNNKFNQVMNKWRRILFSADSHVSEYEFPIDAASAFRFRVRKSPAFAEVGLPHGGKPVSVTEKIRPLVKFRGVKLPEPKLLFSDSQGLGTRSDTHPVRGVANNAPYDFSVTRRGLSTSVRVGVICPQSESGQLHSFLQNLNGFHRPEQSEQDYLVDFPGFQRAFNLPIEIPEPGMAGWVACNEPDTFDSQSGSLSVAHQITAAIQTLQSSYAPQVSLIYFPQRWDAVRGYRSENERFDVHDFVKAFAVQGGISTQFLNEDTVRSAQTCRISWFLSLALYVKAMRTPWVLETFEDDTAYVGLGFSIDRNAEKGRHVVLGCSHIYSARGQGLQYRLSKIEDPIFRGKNPFMSRDDASRTGETIRQLFYDAQGKLPRRVVLHKTTPFIKDEREGLQEGLSGIEEIDMLSIQIDSAQRYVASKIDKAGKLVDDGFPVRRGTVMNLDDYTALLWVHGSADAVKRNWKYYQGKRRIPAPLTLTRHVGSTSLEQLGTEILGLSKMDWNTFELYTKLPATLQSSGQIARIGSMLHRFGDQSFDYRLFI